MKQEKPKSVPATRIVVLITACVVAAIGIMIGLEPDVILVRCLIACGLTGFFTHIVVTLMRTITQPDQKSMTTSKRRTTQ